MVDGSRYHILANGPERYRLRPQAGPAALQFTVLQFRARHTKTSTVGSLHISEPMMFVWPCCSCLCVLTTRTGWTTTSPLWRLLLPVCSPCSNCSRSNRRNDRAFCDVELHEGTDTFNPKPSRPQGSPNLGYFADRSNAESLFGTASPLLTGMDVTGELSPHTLTPGLIALFSPHSSARSNDGVGPLGKRTYLAAYTYTEAGCWRHGWSFIFRSCGRSTSSSASQMI